MIETRRKKMATINTKTKFASMVINDRWGKFDYK